MLEFEENRPRKSRRGNGAAVAVLILAAAAAAVLILHRRPGPGLAQPPAPGRAIDSEAVGRVSQRLMDLGIGRVVADGFFARQLGEASGGGIVPARLQRTAFGFGLTADEGTAWLVPRDSIAAATNLAADEGVALRLFDCGADGVLASPAPSGDGEGSPPSVFFDYAEDGALSIRFIPTDEWVRFKISHLGPLSVEALEPIVTRAPQSLPLLRFLFANTTGKARDAVLAKIREISPIFPERPVEFGGNLVLGGFKVRHGENRIRLFFSCPANADSILGGCAATLTFLANDGSAVSMDTFPLGGGDIAIVSYEAATGAAKFYADREIASGAGSDGHLRFAVSVAAAAPDGSRTPLKPLRGGKAEGGRFGAEFDVFDTTGGAAADETRSATR